MRALSTIQIDVERSFEKALRTILVANGYIPDRAAYASNKAGYDAAKTAIVTSKGFCVEVFGQGAPQDKTGLGVPRIVITGMGFSQGSAGGIFGDTLESDGAGKFNKFTQGTPLSNYRLSVELESNSTSQDRLIESVRQAALPNLSYLDKHDDSEVQYLITYQFTASYPELSHGLIKKVYTYLVMDIPESNPNQIGSNIVPIKEIEVLNDTDGEQIVKVVSP